MKMKFLCKNAGKLTAAFLIMSLIVFTGCNEEKNAESFSSIEETENLHDASQEEIINVTDDTETEEETEADTEIQVSTETETHEIETYETEPAETETEKETMVSSNPDHHYESSLPVLYIDGDLTPCETDKITTVTCNYELIGNGEIHSGTMKVHSRGHASWLNDKKGYKLKLDSKQNLYGMGKSKHWVLISCYNDTTYMRDFLAARLGGCFGLQVMDGIWVDVVLNGQYHGLYYLSEHVRVGKNRIEIETADEIAEDAADTFTEVNQNTQYSWVSHDDLEATMHQNLSWVLSDMITFGEDTFHVSDYRHFDSDTVVSGGYLINVDGSLDSISTFTTNALGRPINIIEPEFAYTNSEMMDYISTLFNTFETAIINGSNTGDFTADYKGQTVTPYDIIDLDSLVAYFWVQEIFMNADGGYRSFYLYKEADQGGQLSKLYVGPIWDMDYSSGGYRSDNQSYPTQGWDYCTFTPLKPMTPYNWAKYYIKDPVFQRAAYDFYHTHRSQIDEMIAAIDSIHEMVADSADADAAVWGVWRYDNDTETEILKNWLNERMAWLDAQMVSFETFTAALQ